MKTRITKLAAAAAIIAAVAAGAYFFAGPPTPTAWGVERAIQALGDVKTVHMSGLVHATGLLGDELLKGRENHDQPVRVEIWARKGEDGFESGDLRMEIKDTFLVVVGKNVTYKHFIGNNQVNIVDGRGATISPWPGRDLLKTLKAWAKDWKVSAGKDEKTGKECIFATCSSRQHPVFPRSWWFQFDAETDLLVSFKQWDNTKREGEPGFHFQTIAYDEELPDGVFEFKIPAGAMVVDKRVATLLSDPKVGVAAAGLSDAEACRKIVADYWQAAMDEDWQVLGRLRPVAHKGTRKAYQDNPPAEVSQIGKPEEKRPKESFRVPCTVKFKDGTVKELSLVVGFGDRNGDRFCVLLHLAAKPRTLESPATQSSVDASAMDKALKDPEHGMSAEGLAQEKACARIVEDCWQAVIQGQWQRAGKFWPALSLGDGKAVFRDNPPVEFIRAGKPYKQDGCGIGPVTPCTIKFSNGQAQEWRMIVMFREIDGKPSCVIAGTWGQPRQAEAD